jgi:ethanolamine permease
VVWAGILGASLTLNALSSGSSFGATAVLTGGTLGVLGAVWCGAAASGKLDLGTHGTPPGAPPLTPLGVLSALPFAVWFFLAVEELPLARDDCAAPTRDIPRALVVCVLALTGLAVGTLCVSCALPSPGVAALATSSAPIRDTVRGVFGHGLASLVLCIAAILGLLASLHSILYAAAHQYTSMAHAGFVPGPLPPKWENLGALATVACLSFGLSVLVWRTGGSGHVGAALLQLSVLGAIVSYGVCLLAAVALRCRRPGLVPGFKSPLGVPGALFALAFCGVIVVTLVVLDASARWACLVGVGWAGLLGVYALARGHKGRGRGRGRGWAPGPLAATAGRSGSHTGPEEMLLVAGAAEEEAA